MSEKSIDKIFNDLNIVDIEKSNIKILPRNSRKTKSILSFKEQKKLKSIVNSNNIPYLNHATTHSTGNFGSGSHRLLPCNKD